MMGMELDYGYREIVYRNKRGGDGRDKAWTMPLYIRMPTWNRDHFIKRCHGLMLPLVAVLCSASGGGWAFAVWLCFGDFCGWNVEFHNFDNVFWSFCAKT